MIKYTHASHLRIFHSEEVFSLELIFYIVIQCIVILSSGVFLTTLSNKSLKATTKILGLSQLPMIVVLGFAPWTVANTPIHINLYFSQLACLSLFFIFTAQYIQHKEVKLSLFSGIIPFLVLLFLKSQPYYLTFVYNSILLTGLFIGLTILILICLKKLEFGTFYTVFLVMQVLALVFSALNLNDWTFMGSLLLLTIAILLCAVHIYRELSHFFTTATTENNYYKNQFEAAVEKEVKNRTFYMEHSRNKILEMNRTDHLTKLLNRKSILADVEDLILDKNVSRFVLFVFDIDFFKKINDTQGHSKGDACLKNLASILKTNSTENDLLGRFGGDEFIVALPMLGYKEGLTYGENLMSQIEANSNPKFTISMGMSVYPWDGETYKQLFEIADKGLYLAKEEGRNQIGYTGYIRP